MLQVLKKTVFIPSSQSISIENRKGKSKDPFMGPGVLNAGRI
jgi:hypothetical protein